MVLTRTSINQNFFDQIEYSDLLCKSILLLGVTAIFYFIYIFSIRPKKLKKFYTKQGFIDYDEHLKERSKINKEVDNTVSNIQELVKKYPNMKGIVFQIGPKLVVSIIDTGLLREFSQASHIIKFPLPLASEFNPKAIIRLEGEKHKRMRKNVSSVFHFDYVVSNIEVTTQVALEKIKEWEENGFIAKEYVDVMKETGNFTAEVVSVLFFGLSNYGIKLNGKRITDLIADLLITLNEMNLQMIAKPWLFLLYKLGLTKKYRKLKHDMKEYKDYAKHLIGKKKSDMLNNKSELDNARIQESKSSRDLITLLLKKQMEATNDEDKLTDEEIIAQYIVFLNAGEDTTSHLITICLYLLTQNPLYITQIKEEVKENVADINHMTYEEINKLTFLQGFLKETLRLYPPAPGLLQRVASKDIITTDGTKIKKDTLLNASIMANSWKESNFNEPLKFDPKRWIGNGEGNNIKDPFVYLPFWAGSRNCIGQHLAMLEAKIFLIHILMKYNMELIPDYKFKMCLRFLYEPYEPVKIKFTKIN